MAMKLLDLREEARVVGRRIEELIPNIDLGSLTARARDEIKYTSRDGRTLIFGFSASTLMDAEGVVQGYIIVFQDLTEIKDLEERLRKTEKFALLGQLAAGLAHEIRNPLSAISGALEVIAKEEEVSRENSRLISIAVSEVDKLHYLLEDFLILTSPNRHSDTVVEINRMAKETVDAFMTAMRRDDIEIRMELCDRELLVQANPHRLKQVLWNMLQNAKQAMPTGGRVFIETGCEGDEVFISIRDEGMGIESDKLQKIFEPFFTTKEIGTGLGLTIAQQVIDSYNGRIEVRSSRNSGTTFVIRLPSYSVGIGRAEGV
jgi:two-component system sensor histidine kinase PilS (NtrC family)